MQDPQHEIEGVIRALISSDCPENQKNAVNRYFAGEAGFRSPFFNIEPGPLSREDILGVYQWYRVMSPKNEVNVTSVVFNESNKVLYVEMSQLFHIRFSPCQPKLSKSLMRFKLSKREKNFVIAQQEDYYHPDDLMNLLAPPVTPLVRLTLSATSYAYTVCAKAAQVFGYWRLPDIPNIRRGGSRGGDGARKHNGHNIGGRGAPQGKHDHHGNSQSQIQRKRGVGDSTGEHSNANLYDEDGDWQVSIDGRHRRTPKRSKA